MNWERFFECLKKRMSKEGADWKRLHWPPGEELVAWWWQWGREKIGNGDVVYLQIHVGAAIPDGEHFLAFRVGTDNADEAYRGRLRDRLSKVLMKFGRVTKVARDHGWDKYVSEPAHPKIGETMRFGVTTDQKCWLARNPNGTPDIDRTVQNLRKTPAIAILQTVARFYQLDPVK